ncbi:hypothetical protein NEF87_001134 [Candidatus Lokiarchaeum ossiferum]|uniref:DUF418 domain-containing protein n=1 Tax=Candidatus Lokiarchaeum ossiferum TaxID=2951803 RepID=A0ABY6HQU1_9ARCH|nr:hypothetical protein NEF87_001134 [Candidatus Lokiarchaeum sp. B-35]
MSIEEKQIIMHNPLNSTRRIQAFDFLRGFAIMIIIFVHRIHYTWTGMENGENLFTDQGIGVVLIIVTIVFFMMAGIFYVVSATVNTYNFYHRVTQDHEKIKQYTKIGIISGFWLIGLNYIQRIFFMNGFTSTSSGLEPEFPIGIFPSLLKYQGEFTWFWSILTQTGTLFVLGINLTIVTGILYLLFKNKNNQNMKQKLRILYILGVMFFILSIFVKFWGHPFYSQLYSDENYFAAFILGGFTTEFGLFPYLSFGLFGSYFGLLIASEENLLIIKKKFRKSILIWLVIGLIGVVVFNTDTDFGDRLMTTAINCVGVALFMLFEWICLKIYDYSAKKIDETKSKPSNGIVTFGKISLTIYILEPLLAEILILPIDLIFGIEWKTNVWMVGLFGILCIAMWMLIAFFWKKSEFIGSFEWCSKKLLKKNRPIQYKV